MMDKRRRPPTLPLEEAFGVPFEPGLLERALTHRSFATHRPIEYALAVLGSMAVQHPVINWAADHRKHHAHTDTDGDPHSPHVGHGSGLQFANPEYEKKSGQWKLCYRAGKEPVEAARAFAKEWLGEMKATGNR